MANWVIGDIHGEKKLLDWLLQAISPSFPDDKLIFVGDNINRGPESIHVISAIAEMKASYPDSIVSLLGNHEMFFLHFLQSPGDYTEKDIKGFGAGRTIEKFIELDEDQQYLFVKSLAENERFYINEEMIVTHAPLEEYCTPSNASPLSQLVLGISNIPDSYAHTTGKLAVAGHRRQKGVTMVGDPNEGGLLLVDTGAGAGGTLSAVNTDSILAGNDPEIIGANAFRTFKGKITVIDNTPAAQLPLIPTM